MQKYNFLMIFRSKIFLAALMFLTACHSGHFDVNTDQIQLRVKTTRLDQSLFANQAAPTDSVNKNLLQSYGSFYNLYLRDILNIGEAQDPMIEVLLDKFRKDPTWMETQEEINKTFLDFEKEQQEIEAALKRYHFFFPNSATPNIVTYNSGFNIGIYPTDTILGIGLEWYLGSENKIVKQLVSESFPQFMKNQMETNNLVPSSLKGWLLYKHQGNFKNENLLDVMIYYGKILFVLKTILPERTDQDILSYAPNQLLWCQNNEFSFWTYLVDNKFLFTQNYKDISRFINDGPFTSGISQESPPRTGIWLGYEMVKQYVKKKNINSLQQLLEVQNAQEFLKYYKPSK
jgi:hypothetical protein